jgi:hypothetical protein
MNQWYRIPINLYAYFKNICKGQLALFYFMRTPSLLLLIAGWVAGSLVYDGIHLSYHFNIDLSWIIPGF